MKLSEHFKNPRIIAFKTPGDIQNHVIREIDELDEDDVSNIGLVECEFIDGEFKASVVSIYAFGSKRSKSGLLSHMPQRLLKDTAFYIETPVSDSVILEFAYLEVMIKRELLCVETIMMAKNAKRCDVFLLEGMAYSMSETEYESERVAMKEKAELEDQVFQGFARKKSFRI